MEAVVYSNFRQNLRSYMKQVNEDADTLIVTTKDIDDTVDKLKAIIERLRSMSTLYEDFVRKNG